MSKTIANNLDSEPLVSVVVPAYDAADFIEKALQSVLNQSYRNIEVIVVDDGSTDETAEVVRAVMQSDSRVKLLQQGNGGIASARNLAIRHSHGEFIAPLDADDVWLPNNLENLVSCMLSAPPSVAVVYTWSMDIDENDRPTGQFHASNIQGYVYQTLLCHYFLANAVSVLIRRSHFDRVGSYNPDFQRCEDWNLMARLARKYEFRVVREFGVLYRKRSESMTHSYDSMALGQAMMVKAAQHADAYVPRFVNALSASLFYGYLAQQSLEQRDADSALEWLLRAAKTNWLVSVLRLRTYSCLVRSAWMKITGKALVQAEETTFDELAVATLPASEAQKTITPPRSTRDTTNGLQPAISLPPTHKLLFKLLTQDVLHFAIQLVCGLQFVFHSRKEAGTSQALEKLSGHRSFTFANRESIAEMIRCSDQLPILPRLSNEFSVSIIIPTRDRPEDLRNCLLSLSAQRTDRRIEIIAIDNNPQSDLTPQVLSEFPSVKLVTEWRRGASYARNAGIIASSGDICVFIDDDIVAPADWLENLIAPLANGEVGAVTGNVMPYELDSPTAKLFEGYANGGFNRGFSRWAADPQWFHSHKIGGAKTWLLGGSGNAAIRRYLLDNCDIGMFQTHIGAGTPAGSSEDTYMFYKIIKMGYSVEYEPTAYSWHKHRQTMKALRHQLFNYSKGFVAYHLTTLLNDGDLRAIPSVAHLPWWHLKRAILRLAGKSSYPLELIAVEAFGHLLGPLAFIQSYLRARKLDKIVSPPGSNIPLSSVPSSTQIGEVVHTGSGERGR